MRMYAKINTKEIREEIMLPNKISNIRLNLKNSMR